MTAPWGEFNPDVQLTRRPFDDVLADFAHRTGRPLWKVTRTVPSDAAGGRIAKQRKDAA